MPVYVYHCEQCGYQFEQQQKFSDKPLKKCPECGHISLHKVYMPVGVIYKGSGFYSTDHRSRSGAPAPGKSNKGEKSGEKSEETKSSPEKTPAKAEKSAD
jgi:putative FmdB family regulatory protein